MLHSKIAYLDRQNAAFKKVLTEELYALTSAENAALGAGRTDLDVPLVTVQVRVPGGLGHVILDGNHRLKERSTQRLTHTWMFLIGSEHEHLYRLTAQEAALALHAPAEKRWQAFTRFEHALHAAYDGLYQRGHLSPDIRFPITDTSPITQAPILPSSDERWPGFPKRSSITALLQPSHY